MQTTREELNVFVDNLSEIVIRFDSGLTMLMDLENTYKSEKAKYLEYVPYFFFHVRNAFIRTSLIEIMNLFDEPKNAKTGIPKMLSLVSSYLGNEGKNDPDIDRILGFIELSETELKTLDNKLSTIKTHRDKAWGHRDRSYFDNPSAFHEKYPLFTSELVEFSAVAKKVCKNATLTFLNVDKEMEFIGSEELRTLIDIFAEHEKLFDEDASRYFKEIGIKQ